MNRFTEAFEKKGYKKKESKTKQKTLNPNLGWLFYKDYFRDLIYDDLKLNGENDKQFEARMRKKYKNELSRLNKKDKDYKAKEHAVIYKNEQIIKMKTAHLISQTPLLYNTRKVGNSSFTLTTTYPGLLLGSGYAHELPDIKGQAILGFDFDYTSGLPILRGSSIKGLLRSVFTHKEYVKSLLNNKVDDLNALEREVFENSDIFFDAHIIDFKEKLLDDDYITPHKSALKDPTPLRFIKVAPDVTFEFYFDLNDGSITKKEKEKLFKTILLDLGLGAKTNVGYGKFIAKGE